MGSEKTGEMMLLAMTATDNDRRHDGQFARSLRILQLGGRFRQLSL
jgi:hypothetical protein